MSVTGTEVKPAVDGKVTVNDGTALTVVVPQPEPVFKAGGNCGIC
jgi:hypothetical protein